MGADANYGKLAFFFFDPSTTLGAGRFRFDYLFALSLFGFFRWQFTDLWNWGRNRFVFWEDAKILSGGNEGPLDKAGEISNTGAKARDFKTRV